MTSLKRGSPRPPSACRRRRIAIVDAQEKLMLARVKFQNQLADLRLTDAIAKN